MKRRLIVGCGYLGERVAAAWHAAGDTVHAVTRSAERAEAWRARGWQPAVADVTRPETLVDLPPVDTLLFAVGYDRRAGHKIDAVYVDGLRHTLDALQSPPERIVYISSTGVYGSGGGAWVDESSPCEPLRDGGRACLAAEGVLREHRWGERSVILRLAGIYGPGRIPRVASLLANEPIDAPAEGYLNLIHVDDAVQVVQIAAERAPLPALYVVSDGHPAVRGDYYRELAALVGAPPPKFVPPAADSPAAARAAADKRVRNERLLGDLAVTLRYPSYREGLRQIVAFNEG